MAECRFRMCWFRCGASEKSIVACGFLAIAELTSLAPNCSNILRIFAPKSGCTWNAPIWMCFLHLRFHQHFPLFLHNFVSSHFFRFLYFMLAFSFLPEWSDESCARRWSRDSLGAPCANCGRGDRGALHPGPEKTGFSKFRKEIVYLGPEQSGLLVVVIVTGLVAHNIAGHLPHVILDVLSLGRAVERVRMVVRGVVFKVIKFSRGSPNFTNPDCE